MLNTFYLREGMKWQTVQMSVSDVTSSVADNVRGALERVSAVYNILPGTWLMEY